MRIRNHQKMIVALGIVALMGSISHSRAEESASFHHVHINSVNPAASIKYYKKYFSGVDVKFRDVADALLTDRSFILFDKVEEAAPSELRSSIWHIGWGGVDGPSDYAWRDREGVEWETPIQPLGNLHFMYAYGPDKEVVEIWTGFHHHRFGHVHLMAEDINATREWYRTNLGLQGPSVNVPKPPPFPDDFEYVVGSGDPSIFRYMWTTQVQTEAVTLNIFSQPGPDPVPWWNYEPIVEFEPTKGRVIDHIAFSYRDLDAAYERMKAAGVDIVGPITEKEEFKMRSFFVNGPDNVLIELVEARPLPQGVWEE